MKWMSRCSTYVETLFLVSVIQGVYHWKICPVPPWGEGVSADGEKIGKGWRKNLENLRGKTKDKGDMEVKMAK